LYELGKLKLESSKEIVKQALRLAQRRCDTMTGVIKKIMRDKGFGFIKPDDSSEDVFFHRGSLAPRVQIEDINEGDTVQFQTRKGDKGPVAFDLKVR
jgi:CspA family cold shock protein